MTNSDGRNAEVLEAILSLRQSLDQMIEENRERSKRLEADDDFLKDYIDTIKDRVDAQNTVIKSVADTQDDLKSKVDGLTDKVDGLTDKVVGLTDDIAEVKGEHARSAMLRSAPLIADALDCQLIAEVPRGVLLGFAKIVEANGEPSNRVQSFKNADMILHVLNTDNQPGYVAVEASFTVDDRDITRAARNADYLQRFTGLPSYPVVAGVDVLQDAQNRIDQKEAHLYRIHPRELQPD